jgi:hypothetical protein
MGRVYFFHTYPKNTLRLNLLGRLPSSFLLMAAAALQYAN